MRVQTKADEVLRDIEMQARGRFLPIIGPVKGRYLAETVRKYNVRKVLEVGTLIGYSAILIAENLPKDGMIYTIEVDEDEVEKAKDNVRKAGYENNVKFFLGNALEVIPQINEDFDMVFLDAAKDEYRDYLKLAEPKLKKGGVVFADNVKMFASAMKNFLDYVRNSGKYRSEFIDVGFDGDEVSVKLF
jgi:predicted O-methyltransferase YrrM